MSSREIKTGERPFRSRAEQAREAALQSQYRRLAIPAVIAALQVEGCAALPTPGDIQASGDF